MVNAINVLSYISIIFLQIRSQKGYDVVAFTKQNWTISWSMRSRFILYIVLWKIPENSLMHLMAFESLMRILLA